jgi:membrane fusion protein (multidrug efflux system)
VLALALSSLGLPFLASCGGARGDFPGAASAEGDKKDKDGAEPKVLVRLGKFERGDISNRLPVSADLEAVERADVPAEIAGVIREVLRREGDQVAKGDPVVRLVDDDLRLAVEMKRLLAQQAVGKVKQADVARREGEKAARQKSIGLQKAKDVYDRLAQLSREGGPGLIPKEEEEGKRLDVEQADVDLAAATLDIEKRQLAYEEAIHSERLAQIELETAEYKLSQTVLRSPIDGAISHLVAKRGERVSTTEAVFKVAATSRLEARLHVPQRELARVRVGLDVVITCEVFPERTFSGKVEVVNPVVDEETGAVRVIVGVTDPEGFLKPGLFVGGEIVLDTRRESLLVPKKAVSYVNREAVVFLVKDGVASRFVMTPGYSTRDHIEVLRLTAEDGTAADPLDGELVLVGHNNLRHGSRVEVE